MNNNQTNPTPNSAPEHYWNRAGEVGYAQAMYTSGKVANHVKASIRATVLAASKSVGLNKESTILELGCGDGDLANEFLSKHFKSIEAHDLAPAGIESATRNRKPNTTFFCSDITKLEFDSSQRFDAVFFIGILHHVKAATPDIIEKVSKITDKIVVLEPNGNHIGRKLLELLPSYKAAGEDSFRKNEFEKIFTSRGFKKTYFKRFNLFPNFTPDSLYSVVEKLHPVVENSEALSFLCTNQVFAFEKGKTSP